MSNRQFEPPTPEQVAAAEAAVAAAEAERARRGIVAGPAPAIDPEHHRTLARHRLRKATGRDDPFRIA
jgi:hypothetical protein